ncbi:MAG: hypothetical protein CL875_02500 [Dehalococcoidales bacterium]|nr:hypothetical protein [Dehalococcoidales bacterium]|tara:strand:- start:700 stop:1899 length:1200 start_codon:yes stop_codon:yes gene_type:complete
MVLDMKKLEPEEREFFEVLKESGRSTYEHAKAAMVGSLAVDHQLVAAVEAKYGPEKAIEMHRKKWESVVDGAFKAAKEVLGIDKVDDLDKLVRIRMFINDGTPCPSKISEEPGRATMTVLACPLVQIAKEVFGEDLDSTWLKAAAATEEWIYPRLIELAGLEDKVVATADKFACLDKADHVCRGIYEWKTTKKEPGEVAPAKKEGRLGDCRDLSLDDVLDYCMAVTNRTSDEQALIATKNQYAGVYLTWKCLNAEFGPEIAEELYWECWKQLLVMSYNAALEKLGMEKPKTARDIGRIHQAFFLDVPSRYKVVKDTEDEWIAEVHWCPNPELGPPDVHARKMAYYKTEYSLSLRVNHYVIELAGLEDEIEDEQPTGYCTFALEYGPCQNCQFIYRKKKK